ncbi:MAG: phosphotransferase, partial [Deinococcus-Thermus bacterium]|nr:phosphotransferase [Deinococcota bacterium]
MTESTDLDQGDVVAFLRSGAASDGDGPAEVVETHGAIVFLCGDAAIKIKRAVRYDYVDLSTRDRRAEMLRRELELNRPAAPMIYRDVVPVTREADGSLALGGAGAPVELALRMWRFPKSAELSEVAARGDLDTPLARRLGEEIRAFHARCPVRRGAGAGLMEGILDELDRVFADMASPLGADRIARFHALSRDALAELSGLLDARAAAGHVRRAHGDLHLGNIVLLEGAPVLFDALEFDETLGTCDVLYDLAFLLMDLWHRDLPLQTDVILTSYL